MTKFVSWYRQPRSMAAIEYLAFMPPYDHGQYAAPEGEWFYTLKLENAHRFETYEAAKSKTPSYDGSHDIEGRSGVLEVFERNGNLVAPPDPWTKPTLVFVALFAAYMLWQFFGR